MPVKLMHCIFHISVEPKPSRVEPASRDCGQLCQQDVNNLNDRCKQATGEAL